MAIANMIGLTVKQIRNKYEVLKPSCYQNVELIDTLVWCTLFFSRLHVLCTLANPSNAIYVCHRLVTFRKHEESGNFSDSSRL